MLSTRGDDRMLRIETTLDQQLPWLAAHPRLRRPVLGLLERIAGEQGFNRALAGLGPLQGFDFVERALEYLGAAYRVAHREREHIPAEGPVLVVANHPLGMLDALVLLHLLGSVRRDVRVLGNAVLDALPQLRRIAPVYWRSRALDQLWLGIGAYLRRHPAIGCVFGPVSLSAALPRTAVDRIVAVYRHYFGLDGLASGRRRYRPLRAIEETVVEAVGALPPEQGLAWLRQSLERDGVSLPVLYRQYVDLVTPAGVRFLDFSSDPAFAGCIDGLVMLDLAALRPSKRARYLGGQPAAQPYDLTSGYKFVISDC